MLAQSNIEMQAPEIAHLASASPAGLCSSQQVLSWECGFIQCGSYLRVCKTMCKDMEMLDIC